ncbi:MAG: TIGR01777 family oxidoreductase [Pyrinomonadaceae bacterium]
MKIIVTGATGLVGVALVRSLLADGHSITRLVRRASTSAPEAGVSDVLWNPATETVDAKALEGHDAAVHLAGEPVAEGRWDEEKKRRILESRVSGTGLLARTLAGLERKPGVLVCASAIGFYGDRGDEVLTEESASGGDFLSEVCREWEKAALPASGAGIRIVNARIGIVLSSEGGALARMLTPFKFGAGGRIGSGKQYMSWVALEDVVGIIKFALANETLRGPVNTVSPNPVTNADFTKALGHALNRPTLFPVPAFAARLAFGEMADALLLSGARVEPAQLKAAHYEFLYPQLEGALRHALAS